MGTKQIEYGEGRVWSFTASVACTSGALVYLDGGKCRPTTAVSQHILGVALIPASAGNACSVIMEGIVKIYTTGVGTVLAGDLFGPGADGKAAEKTETGAAERRYIAGHALEAGDRNSRVMIKLAW